MATRLNAKEESAAGVGGISVLQARKLANWHGCGWK